MASFRKEAGLLGLGVAVAVAGFFGLAVHSAMQFQDSLTQVQINANLTSDATSAMGLAIQEAAIGTTASGTEMVGALAPVAGELQRIVGHALTAADATDVLRASQDLAAGTNGHLATSVKTITDLLQVYHLNASDAAATADTLFRAHTSLGMSTDRLGMMLQRLQPRIAGSGVDMEHLLAIVVQLTPTIGSGTRALMMVGSILQQLQSPPAKVAAALQSMGVQLTDSSGQFIGFEAAVDRIRAVYTKLPPTIKDSASALKLQADEALLAADALKPHTKALGAEETALKLQVAQLKASGAAFTQANFLQSIFGRNATIAAALIKGGSTAIEAQVLAFRNQMTAQQAAIKQDATLSGQLKIMREDVASVGTIIGMVLVPAFQSINEQLIPVINAISTWIAQNPRATAAILALVGVIAALVAGAAVGGPVFRELRVAMEFMGGPVLVLVGGLLLLARVGSSIPGIMQPIQGVMTALGQAASTVGPFIGTLVSAIGDLITGRGSIEAVGTAFDNLGTAVGKAFALVFASLGDVARHIIDWAASMVPTWGAALAKWAGAFVAWITPMATQVLEALGGFALSVIGWIARTIPTLVTKLLEWTGAFLSWIAPLAAQALTALGQWISDVLAWLGSNLPSILAAIADWLTTTATTIADDLVQWTGAFIDWIAPIAGQALTALGQWVSDLSDWIIQQVPVIANQLAQWAGAFVGWVASLAVSLIAGLNTLIDKIASWITSSSTLASITSGLVSWVAPFLAWAGTAAVGAIAALVTFLGSEIIKEGPNIAAAVVGGGVQIVLGLADGIIKHPEAIVGAIGLVLAGSLVMHAIDLAGAAASAAYSGAMKIGQAIADAVSAAWDAVDATVAKIPGAAAGAVYAAALEVTDFLTEALGSAWDNIKNSTVVKAAVAAAGFVTAPLYAAGAAAFGPIKDAFLAMWALLTPFDTAAAVTEGAVVGTAGGTARAEAEIAAYEAVMVGGGGLSMVIPAAARGALPGVGGAVETAAAGAGATGAFSAFASALAGWVPPLLLVKYTLDQYNDAMDTTKTTATHLTDELNHPLKFGPIDLSGLFGLDHSVGTVTASITAATTTWANSVIQGGEQTIANLATAWQNGEPILKTAAAYIIKALPDAIWGARADAVAAAYGTPAAIADALKSGAAKVQDEATALHAKLAAIAKIPTLQADLAKEEAILAAAQKAHNTRAIASASADIKSLNSQIAADVGLLGPSVATQMDTLRAQYATAQADLKNAQATGDVGLIAAAQQEVTDVSAQWNLLGVSAKAAGLAVPEALKHGIDSPFTWIDPPVVVAIKTHIAGLPEFARLAGLATATDFQSAVASVTATAKQENIPVIAALRGAMTAMKADAYGYGVAAATNFDAGVGSVDTSFTKDFAGKIAALIKITSPADEGPLSEAGGSEVWGRNLAQGFLDGFQAVSPRIITVVTTLATLIQGALHATGSAFAWGQNLIQTYASGMIAAIPHIASAATIAASKLAAILKISSPADEGPLSEGGGPEGWGVRFDQLFAQGMLSGAIGRAASTVAQTLALPIVGSGLTPGGGPAFGLATAAAAGGNVTHVHIYLDGQEVKGFVSKVMFEEERRHGGPATAGSPF